MTVPEQETAQALAQVATLGGMFTIRTGHETGDQPLDEACADHAAVGARLTVVGEAYGTNETRVAASTIQYGLAERLLAVLVGVWSHHRVVVDPAGFDVGVGSRRWSLVAARPRAWRVPGIPAAEIVTLVTQRLTVLHNTLRAHAPIAEGLLWGNAATSAMLTLRGIRQPGPLARARTLVSGMLDVDPLRHRLTATADGKYVRRSCCLYYRTNDPRPCSDCPLTGSTVARLRRPA